MEKKENKLTDKILDIVLSIPDCILYKIYSGPRQVVYSYLNVVDLIKVFSLSRSERETILNSKIIKENRKKDKFKLELYTTDFSKYSSRVEFKGLLLAI